MDPFETPHTSARGIRRGIVIGALLAVGMLAAVTACAADRLRPLPSHSLEAILSRGTVGEIQIALEPYDTDARTMSILDRNFISEGLLPVLVVLFNSGDVVYELNPYEIFLMGSDGNPTAAAMATHVARTTGRSELSPQCREAVAGASGILGPIALPLLPFAIADASAQEHNSVLVREYHGMGLPHYIPRGETHGLIFFQVPKGAAFALEGYRVRFQEIGPRGSAEHWQIEIPFMGP